MRLKLLSLGIAFCLSGPAFAGEDLYEEELVKYEAHLNDMKGEVDRLITNINFADQASIGCLKELKAGHKKPSICDGILGYVAAYKYEYKSIKSYNRVRKIPRYEGNLRNLLQRQVSASGKDEGKRLYLSHEKRKQARQERLSLFGKNIQSSVELYQEITGERMDEIADLRKN